MYYVQLAHRSIPHAAALSIPIYTPTNVGVVVFVPDPAHEMAPHVMSLFVNVEFATVHDGDDIITP